MCANLRIAVWPALPGTQLATVEGEVMRAWVSPLNLTGVSTPWAAEVKAARSRMAEQSKAWARQRGFDA